MKFEYKKYYNRFIADCNNGHLFFGVRSEDEFKEGYEGVPIPIEEAKEFAKFLNKSIKAMEKSRTDLEKRIEKRLKENVKI